jgi:hypothetical protein
VKYFREKSYRLFYLLFFVLIYSSALVRAIVPPQVLKLPAYVPQKVKVKFRETSNDSVRAYLGENFLVGRSGEVWMTNHGLVVLDNVSPTDLKVDLSFRVLSDRKRALRISANERVLERVRLAQGWQKVKIKRLMLEPGELLLYLYSPEGTQRMAELKLGADRELSVALKDFELDPVVDYTFGERVRIVKQRMFNFINHINYVYTSVVAFVFLLVALVLHAKSALSSERKA